MWFGKRKFVHEPRSDESSGSSRSLGWRTAHASSIDEKGLIYIYIYIYIYISLRQLPPRRVRVLLVYIYIYIHTYIYIYINTHIFI